MLRLLVPVKRVPDHAQKIRLLPDGSAIDTQATKWILNPFDEIALEEALRIKEARSSGAEVVVVTIGPAAATEQLRTALAMGADRAMLLEHDSPLDSDAAARLLFSVVQKEQPRLVILGKQAIDSDAGQTGSILAQLWNVGLATFASKVDLSQVGADGDGSIEVQREVDGGLETIRLSLPAVITSDLRLNDPRYPTLPGIVKAKKKPIEVVPADSLGPVPAAKLQVCRMTVPPARQAGVRVNSVDELLSRLRQAVKLRP